MTHFPKITFGMIVLNGEPFIQYNLRALYPFSHEIIVVEGAVPGAVNIATEDGHSLDGTLETLYRFKEEEDPEDKLQIVTKEGFWSEKDEMSQAYAQRATGDYLWQVDSDEFYKAEDMQAVLDMLRDDPEITNISFHQISFWGGLEYYSDGHLLRHLFTEIHRVFKWGKGYQYITHRPPTVQDDQGRNLRELKWVNGVQMAGRGIHMYHYSLLFPKQVTEKCDYYNNVDWIKRNRATTWAQESFLELKNPFRVHNVYDFVSWLERFEGEHPEQMKHLWADIEAGKLAIERRQVGDIEALLRSPFYRFKRCTIKKMSPGWYSLRFFLKRVRLWTRLRINRIRKKSGLA